MLLGKVHSIASLRLCPQASALLFTWSQLISWLNSQDVLNSFLSAQSGVSFSHLHADRLLFSLDLRVGRREELKLAQVVDLGDRLGGGGGVILSSRIVAVYAILG